MKSGIRNMLIQPDGQRLYMHCVNNHQTMCVEVASGIVIQSLNASTNANNHRNHCYPLAMTACGTIFFTVNNTEIIAWDHLNATQMSTMKILPDELDMSVIDSSVFISSLAVHPKINTLLSCTLYGASDITTMFLLNNRLDAASAASNAATMHYIENTADTKREAIDRWRQIRQEIFVDDQNINTIDDILERIDDLFHMAIKSPNRTDDYKENIARHKNESVKRLIAMDRNVNNNIAMVSNRDAASDSATTDRLCERSERIVASPLIENAAGVACVKKFVTDTDTDNDSNGTFIVENTDQ